MNTLKQSEGANNVSTLSLPQAGTILTLCRAYAELSERLATTSDGRGGAYKAACTRKEEAYKRLQSYVGGLAANVISVEGL